MLPFVENAFKEDKSLEQAWVNIDLWVTEGWLKFKIIHGTPPHATPEPVFQNVIKRLDSLYPAHYTLKILPQEELFLVKLEIALHKHTHPKFPTTMKMNCLLVDDEPEALAVLESYVRLVENLELVGKCENAIHAFSLLQDKQIDVLFLDIKMPQLLGTDFVRSLRHPPKSSSLPPTASTP